MHCSLLIDTLDTNYLTDIHYLKRYDERRKYRWHMSFKGNPLIIIAFVLLRHLSIQRTDTRIPCPDCSKPLLIIYYAIRSQYRESIYKYYYKIRYCLQCNQQTIFYTFESDAFRLVALLHLMDEIVNLIQTTDSYLFVESNKTKLNHTNYFIDDHMLIYLTSKINRYVEENSSMLINCVEKLNKQNKLKNIKSSKCTKDTNKYIPVSIINQNKNILSLTLTNTDSFYYRTYDEFMNVYSEDE